ncbi:hypothetical protein D3C78_1424470 [compost metagenome]
MLRADFLQDTHPIELVEHLRVRFAEFHHDIALVQLLNDLLQYLQTSDIHKRYTLQANDQQTWIGMGLCQDSLEGLGRAKEQWPFNRINHCPRRQASVPIGPQFFFKLVLDYLLYLNR